MKRKNAGFTLIEVLVAIAVLGIIVVPICSSLVMSIKINTKAESLLQAQLDVSSAVETLMATGIEDGKNYNTDAVSVTTKRATKDSNDLPYYIVIVTSKEVDSVSVETYIRAVETPTQPPDGEGGGTE